MYTDRDFYAYAVNEAADVVGGYERLSAILDVALADLTRWGEGRGRPPAEVLFHMLDLVRT